MSAGEDVEPYPEATTQRRARDKADSDAEAGSRPTSQRVRILAVVGLAALAAGLWATGALDALTDVDALGDRLTGSGVWGPVAFTAIFVIVQPLGVPGLVFALTAAAVWPAPVAFVIIWVGGTGASIVGFAAARWLVRDWVSARLPSRVHVWDERLAERPLPSVLLLRVLTYLSPWADWALGVSSISVRDFMIGTVIGLAPMSLAVAITGDAATRWIGGASPAVTGAALAVVAVSVVIGHRVITRRAQSELHRS